MLHDSGELTVYKCHNSALPGKKPVDEYEKILDSECYGEKTVGFSRYFTAMQNDVNVEMLLQINRTYDLSVGDVVTLSPYSHVENKVYKIVQVQQVEDENNLPMTDISLSRMEGIDKDGLFNNRRCAS